jgi:hypothetical protein
MLDDLLVDIEAFIRRGTSMPDSDSSSFERLALRLFAFQYERNAPYRSYCFGLGKTPRTVRTWKDIPAAPIRAFKTNTLSCLDADKAEAVFMTSGTTNPNERGRHYHPTLQIYDTSMRTAFQEWVMKGRERVRMGVLFPTEQQLPNSSLAHYLSLAVEHFGAPGSAHLMKDHQIDLDALRTFLMAAKKDQSPVALLGATFSFVHVLDHWLASGESFDLPQGSFLLDTGGTKGRSRDIEPPLFYDQMSSLFGVPREQCRNMYGMTELSSQFYDEGNAVTPSYKAGPHWIRTRAVDPMTGRDVPNGEVGVLLHSDLANWNSVTAILTEDIGMMSADGERYQLLGRVEGSAARGCSLAAESFQSSADRSGSTP